MHSLKCFLLAGKIAQSKDHRCGTRFLGCRWCSPECLKMNKNKMPVALQTPSPAAETQAAQGYFPRKKPTAAHISDRASTPGQICAFPALPHLQAALPRLPGGMLPPPHPTADRLPVTSAQGWDLLQLLHLRSWMQHHKGSGYYWLPRKDRAPACPHLGAGLTKYSHVGLWCVWQGNTEVGDVLQDMRTGETQPPGSCNLLACVPLGPHSHSTASLCTGLLSPSVRASGRAAGREEACGRGWENKMKLESWKLFLISIQGQVTITSQQTSQSRGAASLLWDCCWGEVDVPQDARS